MTVLPAGAIRALAESYMLKQFKKDETMTDQVLIEKTKSIHAVLDAAVPIVQAHPEVVAVWAEYLPTRQRWAARYELGCCSSTYLGTEDVFAQFELLKSHQGHAVSYPGAIRFEAREVAEWPKMKAEMIDYLERRPNVAAVFWDVAKQPDHFPDAITLDKAIARARSNAWTSKNFERGLCLFRGQLQDAAPQAAKRVVELVWLLPTKAVELPAGMKIRSADGNELTLLEGGQWSGDGFYDLVRASYDDGATISHWRYPAAIGFPRSRPVGSRNCECCGRDIEPMKFYNRIIGCMPYQDCGDHPSDAEFLAGALGLSKPDSGDLEAAARSDAALRAKIIDRINAPRGERIGTTVGDVAIYGVEFRERYTASNLTLEAEIAAKQAVSDAKRASKVALLGQELRREAGARHPHEGRSERALPIANGAKPWT